MAANAPRSDVIRDAVMLAGRAPSLHDSHPWRWVVDGARLHLWADPRRLAHATDSTGRELTLSCGAALDHVRVAMAATGWDSVTERLPKPGSPHHMATLHFTRKDVPSRAHQQRAAAIRRRRTDRLPFAAPAAWPALEAALRRAVHPHEVMLDIVEDDAGPTLAAASRLGETLRRYDTSYRSELRWWTSPFESDGEHVQGAPEGVAHAFPKRGGGRRGGTVESDHSKVLVLSTRLDDARLDVLRCGEALSAVLLECTLAGMATCTLTHMTTMAMSRHTISQITGIAGQPQLLIRIGKLASSKHSVETSARRLVTEVLRFRN
jgi:hypothetical protein